MSMSEDFKKFAFKGNVVDLAVGVIIGAAFGKVVTGLVENVIMPIIAIGMPNPDWKSAAIPLKQVTNDKGEQIMSQLKYGAFLGSIIDFVVIALVLFFLVSLLEKAMKRKDAEVPKQEALLEEIRDLLRRQAGETPQVMPVGGSLVVADVPKKIKKTPRI